jgi:hypothetical protein
MEISGKTAPEKRRQVQGSATERVEAIGANRARQKTQNKTGYL